MVWGCGGRGDAIEPRPDAGPEPDGTVWQGWPDCDPAAETQTLTFVHVNDLHATYTPDGPGRSPVSRIRGFYEQVRNESPYTVFTHGGDAYEKGSVAEVLTGGLATRLVAHAMEFDVAVMGNHDFAWTIEETLAFTRHEHTVMLLSNATYTGPAPQDSEAVDFAELEVGCVRIGFFGMVSKNWNELNEQTDDPFYPEFPVRHDYAAQASEIVSARAGQVDLMIMVSHLGVDLDLELADQVDGVHVILGGHSHDRLQQPLVRMNGTIIVQAGAYACCACRLDLDVDLGSMEITAHRYELVTNDPAFMPESGPLQSVLDDIMRTHAPDAMAEVAWVAAVRTEPEIARIAARSAVFHLAADAAFADADTVWIDWAEGALTQQDLADTFKVERQPAGTSGFSSFYTAQITGDDLTLAVTSLPAGWVYEGPATLEPQRTYRLALPRYGAQHPDLFLPAGVTLAAPTPACEIWEAVQAYGRQRTQDCIHLDDDTPLPNCP